MSIEAKVLFSLVTIIILGLSAWSLRPDQPRAVDPRWFILRKRDPFFFILFGPSGHPRKLAWCFPVLAAIIWITFIWVSSFD